MFAWVRINVSVFLSSCPHPGPNRDLIRKLLVTDRTRRLGNMKNGAEDVKQHRWFRLVDWGAVPEKKLKPPIVPKLCSADDTSNFETYPENDWTSAPPVSQKELDVFKNF